MPRFDAKVVGDRVKRARRDVGLTQAALAEAAGISDETISRIERGAYEPAVSTMMALTDALGVSLDSLAGRSEAQKATPRVEAPLLRRLTEEAERLDAEAIAALTDIARLLANRPRRRDVSRRPSR